LFEIILYDSQVSGGLLITVPPTYIDGFIKKLRERDVNAVIIGEIIDGDSGQIEIAA
jgi:hydrogenase maturation factor